MQNCSPILGILFAHFKNYTCYCSFAQSCLTLCHPMDCSMPGFPVLHHLSELAQTHVHWVGDAIQPSCPLSSPSPSTFNLSQHQVLFQWVGSSIRWPKYWSFSLSISPSNEYSGLIPFRIDWFDLLAVQGTLKASVLQCLAFFIVQLSHPYMTTGKTIALTTQTFVDKVMSLFFNMLSRLVIAVFPRSKHLLISAVTICSDFGAQENIVCHSFHCFPIYSHEVMGPDAMIFVFWMLTFKPALSVSCLTFIKRLFSSSSLFAISMVSSAYLRLLIFLLAILFPACALSSSAFCIMYSACKLNKQGDNIQPCITPLLILNQNYIGLIFSLNVYVFQINRLIQKYS